MGRVKTIWEPCVFQARTSVPLKRGCKWGYFFFHRKRLEPRVLPWQQHRCYSVSYIRYISGAKFKEHCFNTSRDILGLVLYCFAGATYDIITFLICIIQKEKCHSSLLWNAFQISNSYFLLHRHFKTLKCFLFHCCLVQCNGWLSRLCLQQ